MELTDFIEDKVIRYFWQDDLNCATTQLNILAEYFSIELQQQIIDAAIGMHGAGRYGAQCGLIEGPLMFIGIWGRQKNLSDEKIAALCLELAKQFEEKFGSLNCSSLRPGGFKEDDPPHLCAPLTQRAAALAILFLEKAEQEL